LHWIYKAALDVFYFILFYLILFYFILFIFILFLFYLTPAPAFQVLWWRV